jgi:hypothetical protein
MEFTAIPNGVSVVNSLAYFDFPCFPADFLSKIRELQHSEPLQFPAFSQKNLHSPEAVGWRASYHPDHSGSGIYLPWESYRIRSLFLKES